MINPYQYLMEGYQIQKPPERSLGEILTQGQNRQIAAQQAQDAAIAAEQQQRFNEQTMGSRVQQQGNIAQGGALQNQGTQLGIPAKQVEAQQAGIESNYLNQMFPGLMNRGPGASLPPGLPMSRESDAPAQNQFQGKSLNELRQMKADSGPIGAFLGKFIDPVIQRRSDVEELTPALAEISQAATLPGGTKEEARQKAAALSAVVSKYPLIAGDPRFKEAMQAASPKNTDIIFNPAGMAGNEIKDINSLRLMSKEDAKNYKFAKDALNTAETEYENYSKDPGAPGSRVDQQGIIDKYVMISIGKPATEAQFELAQQFPGLENLLDRTTGKLSVGSIVPKPIIDEMMKNMRHSLIRIGGNLKQQNATRKQAAELGGVDPARVLFTPDDIIDSDSTAIANRAAPGETAKRISSQAEFDALPSGAEYISAKTGKKGRKK